MKKDPFKNEKEINHIAIIMDGNGRWASSRGLPRYEGHLEGLKTLRKLIRDLRLQTKLFNAFYFFID